MLCRVMSGMIRSARFDRKLPENQGWAACEESRGLREAVSWSLPLSRLVPQGDDPFETVLFRHGAMNKRRVVLDQRKSAHEIDGVQRRAFEPATVRFSSTLLKRGSLEAT